MHAEAESMLDIMRYEHTNSASIGSSGNDIILEVQVLVKHSGVQLYLAIETVANLLPVCRRVRHILWESPIVASCDMKTQKVARECWWSGERSVCYVFQG
jgi:hypothetical protein